MPHAYQIAQQRALQHQRQQADGAARTLPIHDAARQAACLPTVEREQVYGPVRSAFIAFRAGHGNLDHWLRLVDAMNVGHELTRRQIASDHGGTFEAGEQALLAVLDRQTRGGSWILKGTEIAALDLALIVHDAQLKHCSRQELQLSVTAVINRTTAALSGNASPGTRIVAPGLLHDATKLQKGHA